jgi:long-chain fatty acid transport protein
MDVFKLGLKYDASKQLRLLGGVSYATDLLNNNYQGLFNVLVPGTIQWHITGGLAYQFTDTDGMALAIAYMPKKTIDGTSPSITQSQTGNIFMEQWDIQLSCNHKF